MPPEAKAAFTSVLNNDQRFGGSPYLGNMGFFPDEKYYLLIRKMIASKIYSRNHKLNNWPAR